VAELYCEQVIVADLDFVSVTDYCLFTSLMLPYLEMYWNTFSRGGCWNATVIEVRGYIVASIPNIAHGAIV